MDIVIDIKKSVEQNAEEYYRKIKKTKKKLEGVKEALKKSYEKLEAARRQHTEVIEKQQHQKQKVQRKSRWYEKFRWFISSSGFLIIGGRDSTTNEVIIKKHTETKDIIFHSEMAGSPFVVIKTQGKEVDQQTLKEAAIFTASYSRVWKSGIRDADVFYVTPDQVSKETKPGEYMPKGSFMIYGKKNIVSTQPELSIGIEKDGTIMAGPISPIKQNTEKQVIIEQGDDKTSQIAKTIQKIFNDGNLDDIIRVLPPGSKLKKK